MWTVTVRGLWLVLLVATVGWAMGSRDLAAPPTGEGQTSLQLIDAAQQAGAIDGDTAVLYRVYSVVDAERLPAAYRGDRPMKDATGVLRHARSRFDALRPEVQEQLRPYLFPRSRR